jgi:hypothetical protein
MTGGSLPTAYYHYSTQRLGSRFNYNNKGERGLGEEKTTKILHHFIYEKGPEGV